MEITAKYITMIVTHTTPEDFPQPLKPERAEKKLFAIIGIIKVFISYTFK